jgi:calcineurin-like phosphoesterase family protein
MDFFTSDTHFFHRSFTAAGRIKLRPQFADEKEMNAHLIKQWNSVVGMTDRVFHEGDFIVGLGKNDPEEIYQQLNGQIFLVRGNHERAAEKHPQRFEWIKDYFEYENHGISIVLFHYALRVWNASHHGAWHLYGHSHGDMPENASLSFDVGVDVWDYRPISLDEVAAKMRQKEKFRIEGMIVDDSSHHSGIDDVPQFGRNSGHSE